MLELGHSYLAPLRWQAPGCGEPVMNGETREAIAVRTLVEAGQPEGLARLAAGGERYGESSYKQVQEQPRHHAPRARC